ncbi:MAG: DNA repair protein RadC [Eubacteriales bacterium]|nr:DNA repair protein RadC [Eubacteriales bacterium]
MTTGKTLGSVNPALVKAGIKKPYTESAAIRNRLSIREMPLNERPYEKFENYGPMALSDAELIAIIIRTGSRVETSVTLAQKILKLDGADKGPAFLSDIDVEELRRLPGIGRVKAIQIKAAAELSRRMHSYRPFMIKTQVRSPETIGQLMMEDMRHLKKEIFRTILLNTKNVIIKITDISIGSLTSSIVHPREVFSEAVKISAFGIIFVHNHPSGDPEPSHEDIETTKRLTEAGEILGIKVIDHVVIGNGSYASFREKGMI